MKRSSKDRQSLSMCFCSESKHVTYKRVHHNLASLSPRVVRHFEDHTWIGISIPLSPDRKRARLAGCMQGLEIMGVDFMLCTDRCNTEDP